VYLIVNKILRIVIADYGTLCCEFSYVVSILDLLSYFFQKNCIFFGFNSYSYAITYIRTPILSSVDWFFFYSPDFIRLTWGVIKIVGFKFDWRKWTIFLVCGKKKVDKEQ
jgi:hypothetical protein